MALGMKETEIDWLLFSWLFGCISLWHRSFTGNNTVSSLTSFDMKTRVLGSVFGPMCACANQGAGGPYLTARWSRETSLAGSAWVSPSNKDTFLQGARHPAQINRYKTFPNIRSTAATALASGLSFTEAIGDSLNLVLSGGKKSDGLLDMEATVGQQHWTEI